MAVSRLLPCTDFPLATRHNLLSWRRQRVGRSGWLNVRACYRATRPGLGGRLSHCTLRRQVPYAWALPAGRPRAHHQATRPAAAHRTLCRAPARTTACLPVNLPSAHLPTCLPTAPLPTQSPARQRARPLTHPPACSIAGLPSPAARPRTTACPAARLAACPPICPPARLPDTQP